VIKMTDENLRFIIGCTMCGCILAVVLFLLAGLFDQKVENDKIFPIIADLAKIMTGAIITIFAQKLVTR